ncbi:FtsX-like permease family protein [Bifidobacterium sp. CP2]|uniref:FtsX-like permease family protein n=1 Tax=Bifidobacterium sp. CP2 TaxID=2809025 RepID=UPI001F0B6555|nr:FtsX-like permease family protein [Bifidobacterium sp. CP2]
MTRCWLRSWKRFVSIAVISLLGVAVLTGIYAGCRDMFLGADRFYDAQGLRDIQVVSTLGLTDDDVAALRAVDGVEAAQGVRSRSVKVPIDGAEKTVTVTGIADAPGSGSSGSSVASDSAGSVVLPGSRSSVASDSIESDVSSGSGGPVSSDSIESVVSSGFSGSPASDSIGSDVASVLEAFVSSDSIESGVSPVSGASVSSETIGSDVSSGSGGSPASDSAGSGALDRPYLVSGRMPAKSGEIAVTRKFLMDSGRKVGDVLTVTPASSPDSVGSDVSSASGRSVSSDSIESGVSSGSESLVPSDSIDSVVRAASDALDVSDSVGSDVSSVSGAFVSSDSIESGVPPVSGGAAASDSIESDISSVPDESVSSGSSDSAVKLTITGEVLDPDDLSNPDGIGSEAFRQNAAADYVFFAPSASLTDGVLADASSGDVYTSISLTVAGAKAEDTFSDRYDDTVKTVADRIADTIQAKRQKARRQQLVDEAKQKIEDARKEADAKFAEAQTQLDQQRDQFNQQVDALAAQALRSRSAAASAGRAAATPTSASATATTAITPELRQTIISQSPQLQQAQTQLDQAQSDLDAQKAETTQQLDEQAEQVEKNIPQARWYVRTRSAIGGFSQLKSDVSSIESIGRAFPVVFLTVAVLMSLTAMTRMVEEERGLIGTYVGLGYGSAAIAARYVLFAALACLIGGGLGLLAGFLGIPAFLLVVLNGLYTVPGVGLEYDWLYGSAGIALFVVGVTAATVVACAGELRQTPAALMRPKAPKAGTRVLLERIRPLWRRMGFLNKVTVRNIMRFKSRLVMTVGGVAGCTALIVCGLAINDSVDAIPARQYQDIYQYDLMVVTDHDDLAAVEQRLRDDGRLAGDVTSARVESGEMTNADDESTTVQLVTVPHAADVTHIAALRDVDGGTTIRLTDADDAGVVVSRSAANALGVTAGDKVELRNGDSARATARVRAVSESVIGSDLYLTTAYYRALFGEDGADGTESDGVELNAVYANLKGSADGQIAYAAKLGRDAKILSAVSTAKLERSFEFTLMGAVVALIVGLAGGLALVVLFTLANTNVSERVREMATFKVLGFYDREVHVYVNKEMLVLTGVGILAGLPLGRWVGGLLTAALAMPGMYFEVHVHPTSYLIAAAVTLAFALLVQLLTNPVLDRIDPAVSLKSVE